LPLSAPITGVDGGLLNEVFVPEGTFVNVSILAANRTPDIWGSDALEWKPDRWLNPLPNAVLEAPNAGVYSHLCVIAFK
jgi:cytochrome P450